MYHLLRICHVHIEVRLVLSASQCLVSYLLKPFSLHTDMKYKKIHIIFNVQSQYKISQVQFYTVRMMVSGTCLVPDTQCVSLHKGKAIPLQAWTGPEGSRRLRLPDFKTIGTRGW